MPTYPTVIDGSENVDLAPYRAKPNYRLGGIYFPKMTYLSGPTRFYISVLKSLDAGDTWSELDSGNRQQSSSVTWNQGVAQCVTATDMWFAFGEPSGSPPGSTTVNNFNFATGTWGTPITGFPAAEDVAGGGPSVFLEAQLGIAVRSNGDIVLIHSYKDTFFGDDRHGLRYSVYSGGGLTVTGDSLFKTEPPAEGDEPGGFTYELVGVICDENDIVHVHAQSDSGNVYKAILPDNAVTSYRRFDDDVRQSHSFFGARGGAYWGIPSLIDLCGYKFGIIPYGATTDPNIYDLPSGSWFRPGVLMLEAIETPSNHVFALLNYPFANIGNWSSIALSQDPSTGSVYLVWLRYNSDTGNQDFTVSCWNGLNWSTPTVLFSTDDPTYDTVDECEIEVLDGVLRAVFASPIGTWYWQGDVTCSAEGCSAVDTAENMNQII